MTIIPRSNRPTANGNAQPTANGNIPTTTVPEGITDEFFIDELTGDYIYELVDGSKTSGNITFEVYDGDMHVLLRFNCFSEDITSDQQRLYALIPLYLLDEPGFQNKVNGFQGNLSVKVISPDGAVKVIPVSKTG